MGKNTIYAHELRVGDTFKCIPVPESEKDLVRVVRKVHPNGFVEWGYTQGYPGFWCLMGGLCKVRKVKAEVELTIDEVL